MKIVIRALLIVVWLISSGLAQDAIKGTYSYTYGDLESLVEARQTCKDLALREAIESYYVFVESSTEVENFQLKDDLVRSMSAGYAKNVQIVEQTEEGRTITITIEATVNAEEVKALVAEMVSAQHLSTSETPEDVASSTTDESGDVSSAFIVALTEYEKEIRTAEKEWGEKKYNRAIAALMRVKPILEKSQPPKENLYQWQIYEAITTRTEILTDLVRIEQQESQGNARRARMALRPLVKKAETLKEQMNTLKAMENLTTKQHQWRSAILGRCQAALELAAKKIIKSRRR